MKYFSIILFFIIIGFSLGTQLGASLYYYFTTGVFQSSILMMIPSTEELLLRGFFSSILSFVPIFLFKNMLQLKQLYMFYLYSIVLIFLIQLLIFWKTTSNFELVTFFDTLYIVILNIQTLCFVVTGLLLSAVLYFVMSDPIAKSNG